ncbi:phage tail sheath family protein [Nonomuraea sp. NPDC003707]
MPEYLAPGVYVEEVSFRSKSIEGVSTTTTGFVGPTRYGPVTGDLEVVTSLLDFERVYGDRQRLAFTPEGGGDLEPMHNYMWHAVRAFFENGGSRLYVKRVFRAAQGKDGRAACRLGTGGTTVAVKARFPGAVGGRRVRFTLRRGQNVLVMASGAPQVRGLLDHDVVAISHASPVSPPSPPPPVGPSVPTSPPSPSPPAPSETEYYLARRTMDGWKFDDGAGGLLSLSALNAEYGVRLITVTLTDLPPDPDDLPGVWPDLPLDPRHTRAGAPDSMFDLFAERPANRADALRLPIVLERGTKVTGGLDFLRLLFDRETGIKDALDGDTADEARSVEVGLTGGDDGARPTADDYEGRIDSSDDKFGLVAFEDIEDISIVAAPGSSFGYNAAYKQDAATIAQCLIAHCDQMRYRIAVLDSGEGMTISQVREMRAAVDSSRAAFYYPWVTVLDPVTQQEIQLPPSGFVTGIYARNDIQRAVYKAPANEVVTLAVGFEKMLNKAQQDVLNPEGVNCFRFFPGRGHRLWGARTATSDPEWKYVNLRRYFAYLEHSIDRGTQWAVFEPNGERLWANVRRTIEDFLFNEWQMGALLGDRPEKAFFVKCDRTTMTQNDLDNGRLVCLIGVAPLRPAEYVIFRIGQWTSDRRS